MAEKRVLTVKPGQKFMHKRKGTIYTVKSVKDETVLLVSEKGDAIMRIHLDSFTSAAFEPVYD